MLSSSRSVSSLRTVSAASALIAVCAHKPASIVSTPAVIFPVFFIVFNFAFSIALLSILQTTDLGDGARDYTPGVKSATGSATIFYYDSGPESLINKVLQTGNIEDSDKVALSLRWGSTRRINATVLVTSADVGLQTGEVMTASINFTVCGDYTSVTL